MGKVLKSIILIVVICGVLIGGFFAGMWYANWRSTNANGLVGREFIYTGEAQIVWANGTTEQQKSSELGGKTEAKFLEDEGLTSLAVRGAQIFEFVEGNICRVHFIGGEPSDPTNYKWEKNKDGDLVLENGVVIRVSGNKIVVNIPNSSAQSRPHMKINMYYYEILTKKADELNGRKFSYTDNASIIWAQDTTSTEKSSELGGKTEKNFIKDNNLGMEEALIEFLPGKNFKMSWPTDNRTQPFEVKWEMVADGNIVLVSQGGLYSGVLLKVNGDTIEHINKASTDLKGSHPHILGATLVFQEV